MTIDSAKPPLIRLATDADAAAINDIYNHFVLNSTCTYQEVPTTLEERQAWLDERSELHPATVAEISGQVVGWASVSAFRTRSAYRWSLENAVYVRHDHHGRGIGSALLADSIQRATTLGHRSIVAVIDAEQACSIALHRKFGFEQVAYLKQIGFKFGRWLDTVYLQRVLDLTPKTGPKSPAA
jgi:L-amino acid N-acyltransferase